MKSDSVLAGKYRLISLLGSGGMGSVWRAEHLGLRAPVAVKLLASDLDGRQDSSARFLREAQSAANLRSPHVVQVFDHGLDEATQTPFIAMELMEGESLAERLSRVVRLSPAETSKLITQAARALIRAHELGIIHRDLKPANLFLVRNEDDEILKVLDFGLAKWRRSPGALSEGALTATDHMMGTPYYMSPEQMTGAREADERSDLWALGVIAFECLTGTRPFDAGNLVSIALKVCGSAAPPLDPRLGLPAELDRWFERALAKEPADRFQTARELADELRLACRVDATLSVAWQAEPARLASAAPEAFGNARTLNVLDGASANDRGAAVTAISPQMNDARRLVNEASSANPVVRSIAGAADLARRTRRRLLLAAGIAALSIAALSLLGILRHRAPLRSASVPTPSASPTAVEEQVAAATGALASSPVVSDVPVPVQNPNVALALTASAAVAEQARTGASVPSPNAITATSKANASDSPPKAERETHARQPTLREPATAGANPHAIDIQRTPSF